MKITIEFNDNGNDKSAVVTREESYAKATWKIHSQYEISKDILKLWHKGDPVFTPEKIDDFYPRFRYGLQCSKCRMVTYIYRSIYYRYCPHCGTEMNNFKYPKTKEETK